MTRTRVKSTKTAVSKPRAKRATNGESTLEKFSPYTRENTDEDIPKIVSTKNVRAENLRKFSPLTENQTRMFEQFKEGHNLVCSGSAGTGKSFLSLFLAFREVLMRESECEKVVVVRSPIATTDVGFLPGDLETKLSVLESPYIGIINELFDHTSKDKIYEKLKEQKLYEFVSCAYLRGMTINNAIIIVDEYQNLDFHSFDSIITRVGRNSKIILCGDDTQTDLTKSAEITGMKKIHHILDHMASFRGINFTIDDVVRSGLCKEYLLTKHRLGL